MALIDMGSKFWFDGENKLFIAKAGVVTFDHQVDLYSDWKEMMVSDLGTHGRWLQALRSTGGDPLPGGQIISPYVFLENGFKIRPYEADHNLIAVGDLFTADGTSAFVPTVGAYNVVVELQTSSKSITSILVDWTQAEKDSVLADLELISKFETGRWKIDVNRNQMIFYDEDGVSELKVFDLKDQTGQPSSDLEIFERVPV